MVYRKGAIPPRAAYVGKFVEEAKAEGLVKSAIERGQAARALSSPHQSDAL
jgi:hypothetical protein